MSPWPEVELGDHLRFLTSGSRGWAKHYTTCGAKFLRIQNVGRNRLLLDDLAHVSAPDSKEAERTRVEPGDVLLSITAVLGRTAVVPAGIGIAHINQHLAILRLDDRLDPQFASAYIAHGPGRFQVAALDRVGVKSGLNFDRIRSIKIPLPPLAEQRRIADILDKADAIRRKRKEAIALTEELLRSAFLDMFGDPVTNPKGWPLKPLRTAIREIQPGWSASSEDRSRRKPELGVLKVSAVTSGWYRPEENKLVAEIPAGKKLVVPERGDLLFSRANTRDLVAATCIVEETDTTVFLPDKLWRVRTTTELLPEVLAFTIKHPRFRHRLTKRATGTSGSMLNIAQAKVKDTLIPLPPMSLQRRFRNVFWAMSDLRKRTSQAIQLDEDLFNSLVQRAFRGEL